jgi:hypothetical protein
MPFFSKPHPEDPKKEPKEIGDLSGRRHSPEAEHKPNHKKEEKKSEKHSYGVRLLNYRTAPPGTLLRIAGIGFGKEQGKKNTVLFADSTGNLKVNGHPTEWSDTEIAVPIPNEARTGDVAVLRDGKFSNKLHLNISPEGVLIPWST